MFTVCILLEFFRPKAYKLKPKTFQNASQIGPKTSRNWVQNLLPKTLQQIYNKWFQNASNMLPKWTKNQSKMGLEASKPPSWRPEGPQDCPHTHFGSPRLYFGDHFAPSWAPCWWHFCLIVGTSRQQVASKSPASRQQPRGAGGMGEAFRYH
jgi:hypothetical protein